MILKQVYAEDQYRKINYTYYFSQSIKRRILKNIELIYRYIKHMVKNHILLIVCFPNNILLLLQENH